MGMKKFSLRFGKGTVQFQIPEGQLLYEITGKNHPALPDLSSAYLQALDHPIDAPPLKEIVKPNDRVAITVSDITSIPKDREKWKPKTCHPIANFIG